MAEFWKKCDIILKISHRDAYNVLRTTEILYSNRTRPMQLRMREFLQAVLQLTSK